CRPLNAASCTSMPDPGVEVYDQGTKTGLSLGPLTGTSGAAPGVQPVARPPPALARSVTLPVEPVSTTTVSKYLLCPNPRKAIPPPAGNGAVVVPVTVLIRVVPSLSYNRPVITPPAPQVASRRYQWSAWKVWLTAAMLVKLATPLEPL